MFQKDRQNISFVSVAMAIIIAGVLVFSWGLITWLFNIFGDTIYSVPSSKIIGGLIVLSLGYIQLEIELLRKK